jgi:hypothetical protein
VIACAGCEAVIGVHDRRYDVAALGGTVCRNCYIAWVMEPVPDDTEKDDGPDPDAALELRREREGTRHEDPPTP